MSDKSQSCMKEKVGEYIVETKNLQLDYSSGKDMSRSPDVLLASYKNSWGEIDVSLPVLYKVKDANSRCKIVSVIESAEMLATDKIMPVLFGKLSDISDVLLYPAIRPAEKEMLLHRQRQIDIKLKTYTSALIKGVRSLFRTNLKKMTYLWTFYEFIMGLLTERKWSFLFKYSGSPSNIKVILEDHTKQSKFQIFMRKKCPDAQVILYPHATSLYINDLVDDTLINNKTAHTMLLSSSLAMGWAKNKYPNVKFRRVVGFSRYDRWWIDALLLDGTYANAIERELTQKFSRIFTFFTHDFHPIVLPYDAFKYFMRSVADVIFSYNNSCMIIKPHPRQDVHILESLLQGYPSERWVITNMQALQASALAHFVVAMWSSTILDALAVDKPVVEFFDHTKNPRAILRADGRKCSEYGCLGLSIPADTKEELQRLIDDYFSATPSSIWKDQKKTALDILKLDNQSSLRAAEIICNLMHSPY